MFLKLILFLAYIVILFILARIIETLTWIEVGNLSRRLLDPMTMSVIKLKALLEQRGINYEGAIEKQELAELVESSGAVAEDSTTSMEEDKQVTVTNFTTGSLFDEHVEDAKDSVWLVYIIADHNHVNYLADTSWHIIKQKVSKFGVNLGVFDCSLDPLFCMKREWFYSCLILGLPEEFQTKSKVTLFKYNGPFKVSNIHSWIKDTISKKVHVVDDWDTYTDKWIKYATTDDLSEVRVVMFSNYPSVPLFYSSVSVKFPGRVKFGFVHTNKKGGKDIITRDHALKSPAYLIITKEYMFLYGKNFGEDLSFQSMETYLKTLYPCVNDIFVLSLLICNCLTFFELSLTRGTFLKRLMKFIWCIVKFNMCLLLLWITMLTLFKVPLMHNLTTFSLKFLRLFRLSIFGTYLYKDYCFYSGQILFTELFFCFFIILIGFIQYKRQGPEEDELNIESNEWNFAQFRTLEHLFSPTAGLFRTAGIPAIDPERVNMRDMPTLQQICKVPDDYINKLPKWQFRFERKSDSKGKGVNAETIGNMAENLGQEKHVTCFCSSELSVEEFQAKLCQFCSKFPNEQNALNDVQKPCEQFSKVHSNLDKLKNSDIVSTDQSDTDQERDVIDEDHLFLENNQCVICLDDYNNGVWLCGLPCGHSFHQSCIHTWLNRDNHYCPVCRWTSYTPKPTSIHLHSE